MGQLGVRIQVMLFKGRRKGRVRNSHAEKELGPEVGMGCVRGHRVTSSTLIPKKARQAKRVAPSL